MKVTTTDRVIDVLQKHSIECTGLGEVTCRGCRERSWMTWPEYREHVAQALDDAGVLRSDDEQSETTAQPDAGRMPLVIHTEDGTPHLITCARLEDVNLTCDCHTLISINWRTS